MQHAAEIPSKAKETARMISVGETKQNTNKKAKLKAKERIQRIKTN